MYGCPTAAAAATSDPGVGPLGIPKMIAVPSEYDAAKKAVVDKLNSERAEAGVPLLREDDEVATLADLFCARMLAENFVSHYDPDGYKPYQRYFFGGCTAHVTENVIGFDAKEGKQFDLSLEAVQQQMLDAHAEIMFMPEDATESPPARADVLDAHHTDVAVGIAVNAHGFRFVEVYIDRYVEVLDSLPDGTPAPGLHLTSDETFLVVKSLREDMDVVGCTVYYEPHPAPLAIEALNAMEGYEDYTGDKVAAVWPWEMIRLENGALRVPIFLSRVRDGHYYVQVRVRSDPGTIPYDAPSEDLDISAPEIVKSTGLVLTCGKSDVAKFQQGVKDTAAADGPGADDVVPQGADEVITDMVAAVGFTPPADGYRQQWSLAASLTVESAAAWMASSPGAPPVVDVRLVASDVEAVDAPDGFTLLPQNLVPASAAAAGGEGAQFVYLAVKHGSSEGGAESKDGAEEGKGEEAGGKRDVAVAYVVAGVDPPDIPDGYASSETPCIGGRVVLVSSADASAVQAAAEAARARAAAERAAALEDETADAAAAAGIGEEASAYEAAAGLGDEALEGGYEDGMDWRDADEDEGELADAADDYEDPEAEAERRIAERDRVYQMLQDARMERERLIALNHSMQRKLTTYFAARKPDDEKEEEKSSGAGGAGGAQSDTEKSKRYEDTLSNVNKARDDLEATRSSFDAIAMDLQARLDEKEAKASEIQDAFVEFKREIAKAAENSRTGKPIPRRIIKQFEATEAAKDAELEKVRLKNIHLRTQLRKLETRLKEKEQLADGLHLIDFEQLKIENQTLNEKIEERNEELHKLRKKTTTTVQVLTHIKEKLQFVQAEAVVLKRELAELESRVTGERDRLNKAKHERDALRQENDKIKQQQGVVNSHLLVKDYRTRKAEAKVLQQRMEELQERYEFLTAQAAGGTGAGMSV